MTQYILDLESDGLIPRMTKVHSIVLKNIQTNELISCANQEGYYSLDFALDLICNADLLIGHNIVKFDVPALKKIYPWLKLKDSCRFYDTLITSRLFWPELDGIDHAKWSHIAPKYVGRHSLAAWGERLGVAKIKFTGDKTKQDDVKDVWAEWSQSMQIYCMAGHHKFLRDDLSWVPCKDINEGDTVLGFDEFPEKQTGRCFKPTKIIKKTTDQAELFRVTLKSGKTFDVTAEHKWLVRNYKSRSSLQNPFESRTQLIWVETKDLMKSKCFAIKYMDTWKDVKTWEAGYLAGIFDGEGSVRRHQKWDRLDYSFAQKPGVVHDLACKIINNLGFKYTTRKVLKTGDCDCIRVVGTCYEKLRLLGMIKPARLIKNAQPFERLGRCEVKGEGDFDEIISITSVGIGVIYKISTDSKTFVLDGYAHHNCEGDVAVSDALYSYMKSQIADPRSLELEHEFAIVMSQQEQFGFPFNEKAAFALVNTLKAERAEIDDQLQKVFPPITEKRISAKTGKQLRDRITVFNPASRQQTVERLKALYPEVTFGATEKGNPKVDDDVLEALGAKYPEAKLLARYQLLNKRLGQLADGKEAWLKHCQIYGDGRIHGEIVTNACVSGRCAHKRPNMAQVPSVGHAYGAECRALFYAPEGWELVGADASGLELRALAAMLAYYDRGEYAQLVSNPDRDVHFHNACLFGIHRADLSIDKVTRDLSKRLIYCILYGGGAKKTGSIICPEEDQHVQYEKGKKTIDTFYSNLPAIKQLKDAIDKKITERGYLVGIDGRRLQIRSRHSALNQLLQSTGAIAVKKATTILYEDMTSKGFNFGKDWGFVAHVHDEYQSLVRPEYVELYKELAIDSFRKSGEYFKLKCPLTGEAKSGKNWMETH
jgi:DNA polymerase I-like protein with 3'-5' exonuclease and polymerase domains